MFTGPSHFEIKSIYFNELKWFRVRWYNTKDPYIFPLVMSVPPFYLFSRAQFKPIVNFVSWLILVSCNNRITIAEFLKPVFAKWGKKPEG